MSFRRFFVNATIFCVRSSDEAMLFLVADNPSTLQELDVLISIFSGLSFLKADHKASSSQKRDQSKSRTSSQKSEEAQTFEWRPQPLAKQITRGVHQLSTTILLAKFQKFVLVGRLISLHIDSTQFHSTIT